MLFHLHRLHPQHVARFKAAVEALLHRLVAHSRAWINGQDRDRLDRKAAAHSRNAHHDCVMRTGRAPHPQRQCQYAAIVQSPEPLQPGMSDARADQDCVNRAGIEAGAVPGNHGNIGVGSQIRACLRRQALIDFDGGRTAFGSHRMRHDGCVVASAAAKMKDPLARAQIERRDRPRNQARLSVVQRTLAAQGHEHIVI